MLEYQYIEYFRLGVVMISSVDRPADDSEVFAPLMAEGGYRRALCLLESREKFLGIREVVESCSVFDNLPSRTGFIEAVYKREILESTGIGHGVAIAHGKLPSIKNVSVALGISSHGIPFESIDGKDVHLLFVIGSSTGNQKDYLIALSSIMKFIRNPSLRSYLVNNYGKPGIYNSFFDMLQHQNFTRF